VHYSAVFEGGKIQKNTLNGEFTEMQRRDLRESSDWKRMGEFLNLQAEFLVRPLLAHT
jgi:hypothetical protein